MWDFIRVKRATIFDRKMDGSVELFLMASISDIPNIKYWYNLGKLWMLQNRRSIKNS